MKCDFDYLSKEATTDEGLNRKQTVYFHYFNPNGIYEAAKVLYREINLAVERGDMMNGAILAYGSLNTYGYDQMNRLASKQNPTWTEIRVWLNMWQKEIDRGYAALIESAK